MLYEAFILAVSLVRAKQPQANISVAVKGDARSSDLWDPNLQNIVFLQRIAKHFSQ